MPSHVTLVFVCICRSVLCLVTICLLGLRKCTPRSIYGCVHICCALIVQYPNRCLIAHFRVAWRKTKPIYPCTQTFIVVISTLFNLTKSCYACIHFRSGIVFSRIFQYLQYWYYQYFQNLPVSAILVLPVFPESSGIYNTHILAMTSIF